jgi:hypothetical protein
VTSEAQHTKREVKHRPSAGPGRRRKRRRFTKPRHLADIFTHLWPRRVAKCIVETPSQSQRFCPSSACQRRGGKADQAQPSRLYRKNGRRRAKTSRRPRHCGSPRQVCGRRHESRRLAGEAQAGPARLRVMSPQEGPRQCSWGFCRPVIQMSYS